MSLLSCLTDAVDLVADASVIINLNATGCGELILRALPNRVSMVGIAASELEDDRRSGRQDGEYLLNLIELGLIQIVELDENSEKIFGGLVAGPAADTLDDGEAATIAFSLGFNAQPIIDDRKAIRLCRDKFSKIRPASTVDILSHANVQAAFGRDELANAVFNSLQRARMRVLPHHTNWVVELIGGERARLCASLSKAARLNQL